MRRDIAYPVQPVLIVDDEIHTLKSFETNLLAEGINNVEICQTAAAVPGKLAEREYAIMLLDLVMPDMPGVEVLAAAATICPDMPVLVVTGMNDLDMAVQCMKSGAFDYLVKPVDQDRLITAVRHAVEVRELRGQMSSLKRRIFADRLEQPEAFESLVTGNRRMMAVCQYAETIAPNAHPVLITGETGVGKEIMAAAIHRAGGRPGRFVAVNVAGLDDNLFSDALFGHMAGAFTGAEKARDGLIRQAANGTLFLDEIGDLSMPSQIKLLRLLQEREYYPLGADLPRRTDARVIVATNRSLRDLQSSADFRQDLFYRLQTHHISIPPLRERRDDLPLLLKHLLEKAARSLEVDPPAIPHELPRLLAGYGFPGNVRELESMILDALSRCQGGVLPLAAFEQRVAGNAAPGTGEDCVAESISHVFADMTVLPPVDLTKAALIDEALKRTNGNQASAARLLGLSQQSVNYWLHGRKK